MFNLFQNRVKNFLYGLTQNPAQSSRVIFASLLIVGMVTLTFDMGPQMAPQYFGARLFEPIDQEVLDEIKAAAKKEDSQLKSWVTSCSEGRTNKDDVSFLENFENSFAGILPGAGNLLLEHPTAVSNRKESLAFEVMKRYANKKFCIPESQFKITYLSNYRNTLKDLDAFFQVRLCEIEGKENCSSGTNNPVFISTITTEFAFVEKDLMSTQKYVEEIIDRAIESAIGLDRWTEQRLNNLTAKTSNSLTLNSNELIKIGNDTAKENVKVNSGNSEILAEINKVLASFYAQPIGTGGAGVPRLKGEKGSVEGVVDEDSTLTIPSSKEIDQKKTGIESQITFGLLNIVNKSTRDKFLEEQFGVNLAFYVAAVNRIDPFVPNSEIKKLAKITEAMITSHLCENIDSTKEDAVCFPTAKSKRTNLGGSFQVVQQEDQDNVAR